MFASLYERTKGHFNNVLMLASTFMDPRYRSFKFIKDQSERDLAKFKAMNYIKSVCKDSSSAAPITPVIATLLSTRNKMMMMRSNLFQKDQTKK